MTLIAFLYGAVIGSFLNVVVYRLPRGLNLARPASHCPVCGHRLGARDLVPVASWLCLGRRCRYCGAPIPWRYPLVELGTGCAFAWLTWRMGISPQLLAALAFSCLWISALLIRYDARPVPRSLLVPLGMAAVAHLLVTGGAQAVALYGALAGIAYAFIHAGGRPDRDDTYLWLIAGLVLGIRPVSVLIAAHLFTSALFHSIMKRVYPDTTERPIGLIILLAAVLLLLGGSI